MPGFDKVEITAKVYHGSNVGKAYQGIDATTMKETKGCEYNWASKYSIAGDRGESGSLERGSKRGNSLLNIN
jgi:hypothetical protein